MAEEIKAENIDKADKAEKPDKKEKKTAIVKTANKPAKEKVSLGARFKKFIKDYRSELKKIVWPTRSQVIKNTGIVLAAIVFMAVVVGLLDLLFGFGIQGLAGIKSLIGS